MSDLSNFVLQDLLPSSIVSDENVKAIAKGITERLLKVNKDIELLKILPSLQVLPETVVDQLAWHFSVDFYDTSMPRAVKEALLYQSIAWHRRKGTVKVVEEIVEAVHHQGRVVENWDYGGIPYHFKVIVNGEPIQEQMILDNLVKAINSVKNVRSWLDGIEYERGIEGIIYTAGAVYIHREVRI